MWLAEPWWVNALILVPPAAFWGFRRNGLNLAWSALAGALAFGAAFGFVEAVVVVYLRIATGLLPIAKLADLSSHAVQPPTAQVLNAAPPRLVNIETWREAATMVMLLSVAFLAGRKIIERAAIFLWTFATWDLAYYAGLRVTIAWPASWRDLDVLFLIPVPWISQVWFPIVISALTLAAILAANRASLFSGAQVTRKDP